MENNIIRPYIRKTTACLTTLAACLLLSVASTSCSDYLNEQPKGQNIPSKLSDFSEMLNYEYGAHRYDITQAAYLMGDRFCSPSYLNGSYPLYQANYLWDTSINRREWNNSDETTYYQNYSSIAISNLVIENALTASGGTEAEAHTVYAYAQALRAMAYYQLANYYANAYSNENKGQLSVPYITSTAVNAPYTQVTLEEIYSHIISDVENAIPYLPDMGRNILLPGKAACYAFLSRVYLTMMDYEKAERYADMALGINDKLFDWTVFYSRYREGIEAEGKYVANPSPMGFDYCENYDFKHGSSSNAGKIISLPEWRSQRVEDGDAKFYSSWKWRDRGSYIYYEPMLSGYFNYGGCKTVEQYLIKAECLARRGNISEAMDILNKVRKTRIMPDKYAPVSASTAGEAIAAICRTKWNDLIGSVIPFADIRRLNAEGQYPYTLTYVRNGKTDTLAPDSYLWTMVFPMGAIENHGGGKIEYIATK